MKMILNEETKKQIAKSEEDIKKGRVYTLEQVKKKLLKNSYKKLR